jgi:hypothetical protein
MSTIERLDKKAGQLEMPGSGIQPRFGVLIPIANGRTTLLGTAPTTHLATRNGLINPLPYIESGKAHDYDNNYISSHLCLLWCKETSSYFSKPSCCNWISITWPPPYVKPIC